MESIQVRSVADRPGADAWKDAVALAAITQFAVWAIGSVIFVTNLHYDTLELIYWGREWLLSYGKHPPLATWILDWVQYSGAPTLTTILILGQVCVLISVCFVWSTTCLVASPRAAAFASILFLASPTATYFSVQVNHNSLLLPFWCMTLYAGIRLLIRQDRWSGVFAGVSAGLAMLVKYEVLFLLLTLIVIALTVPKYRTVLWKAGPWTGALITFLILVPHLYWLSTHDWSTVAYALDAQRTEGWFGLIKSANDLVVGQMVLLIAPALVYGIGRVMGISFVMRDGWRVPAILAFGPSVAMLIGAILTRQDPRQGWTIPFSPNIAVAFAMAFRVDTGRAASTLPSLWGRRAALLSIGQFGLFVAFLFVRDQIGAPVVSFDLRSRVLAEQVREVWEDRQKSSLKCVVIGEKSIAASAALWLEDRPNFVDLSSPYWATPDQVALCREAGAIGIVRDDSSEIRLRELFPRACDEIAEVRVPTRFGGRKAAQSARLLYIPPSSDSGECSERK